jgi:hypothetical protein
MERAVPFKNEPGFLKGMLAINHRSKHILKTYLISPQTASSHIFDRLFIGNARFVY